MAEIEIQKDQLFEFSLVFRAAEVATMLHDAQILISKGILKSDGDEDEDKLNALIRFASLDHLHRAVEKIVASDMETATRLQKSLNEVNAVKTSYEQKKAELEQREEYLARMEEEVKRIMVKWAALANAQGLLEVVEDGR